MMPWLPLIILVCILYGAFIYATEPDDFRAFVKFIQFWRK